MATSRVPFRDESAAWLAQLEAEERALEVRLRREHRTLFAPSPTIVLPGYPSIPELPDPQRGVYVAPFLDAKGRYVLYGVARTGRYIIRQPVHDLGRWDEYYEATRAALDALDPQPVRLLP